MKSKIVAVLALAMSLGACADVPPPTSNLTADQLEKLVSGHVMIQHAPRWRGSNGEDVRAFYDAPDGSVIGCSIDQRKKKPLALEDKWQVVPDAKFGALFGVAGGPDKEFDPEHVRYFLPVIMDLNTGLGRTWFYSRGRYFAGAEFWFQDSWPEVMLSRCPDLKLPDGLEINHKQTAHKFRDMKEQDPGAIIRPR